MTQQNYSISTDQKIPSRVRQPTVKTKIKKEIGRTNFFKKLRLDFAKHERPTDKISGVVALGLAALGFIAGLFSVIIVVPIEYAVTIFFNYDKNAIYSIGALIEEIVKFLFVLAIAFSFIKSIPNRRFGVIIGVFVGLGFGIFESFLYIWNIMMTDQLL